MTDAILLALTWAYIIGGYVLLIAVCVIGPVMLASIRRDDDDGGPDSFFSGRNQ